MAPLTDLLTRPNALDQYSRLLVLVVIQFGLAASALAEPFKTTGEALRLVVSGRTVLIETPIGSFPIRYALTVTVRYEGEEFAKSKFLMAPQIPGLGEHTFDHALRFVPMSA